MYSTCVRKVLHVPQSQIPVNLNRKTLSAKSNEQEIYSEMTEYISVILFGVRATPPHVK